MNLLDLPERLQSTILPEPMSGCWLWMGPISGGGYGSAYLGLRTAAGHPKSHRAHRVVFEALRGAIPAGLELDHKCRTRCCVNPDHLEPMTHAENVRRSENWLRAKTHCAHGHEFTKDNTKVTAAGRRKCRECHRADGRARKARQRREEQRS